jgi:hypothetical protein
MKRGTRILALAVVALLAIPLAALTAPGGPGEVPYEVTGRDFRIIGDFGDNLAYDGEGVLASQGKAKLELDPVANTGKIVVEWMDPRQSVADLVGATAPVPVRVVQTVFMPPDHPSGVLSDGNNLRVIEGDPIPVNHFEHGSTGVGAPIVTNLFTFVGTWGPAEVYVQGRSIGTLAMHTMTTEGVRDETTDQVYNADKSGFYSPMAPDDGFVDADETQLHVILRSFVMDPDNFPPFSIFWHLMFYEVEIETRG